MAPPSPAARTSRAPPSPTPPTSGAPPSPAPPISRMPPSRRRPASRLTAPITRGGPPASPSRPSSSTRRCTRTRTGPT
jgi:hypothetical protein